MISELIHAILAGKQLQIAEEVWGALDLSERPNDKAARKIEA